MKILPACLFFAAFCVFAFSAMIRFEVVVSVAFVTALAAVILSDYGRSRRPAAKPADVHVPPIVPHHP